jgi:hypothetical protein
MTHVRWHALVIGAFVMLAAPRAKAQQAATDFGRAGGFAISAERLFGFVRADETTNAGGMDRTTHFNSLSILGNSLGLFTAYAQPRVGGDFFVAEGLSVGASLSYFRVSESADVAGSSSPTFSGYVLAPRIGYSFVLGRMVSLWPRVGFTYTHLGTDTSTAGNGGSASSGTSLYALTIEAPFVFAVAEHFFFSAAPTLDLGVGGSNSSTGITGSSDVKETDYGVLLGLGGFL